MKLTKEQVASRQLDTAIKMMLNGGDPVSVHTLASASSAVFSDLLMKKGETRWRDHIVDRFQGEERRLVISALRHAERFFKHADQDPYDDIDFNEEINDGAIFIATCEYDELIKIGAATVDKLTIHMSVFQYWYFAQNPSILIGEPGSKEEHVLKSANKIFPGIRKQPRFNRLAMGARVLKEETDPSSL